MGRHVFVHTNKKLINKKQKTFRQNIFNNLSPGIDNILFYSINRDISKKLNNINRSNKIININKENKLNDMNNISDINNPIIKKNIESINFFGPYFSFFPSCRSKNMEFYINHILIYLKVFLIHIYLNNPPEYLGIFYYDI